MMPVPKATMRNRATAVLVVLAVGGALYYLYGGELLSPFHKAPTPHVMASHAHLACCGDAPREGIRRTAVQQQLFLPRRRVPGHLPHQNHPRRTAEGPQPHLRGVSQAVRQEPGLRVRHQACLSHCINAQNFPSVLLLYDIAHTVPHIGSETELASCRRWLKAAQRSAGKQRLNNLIQHIINTWLWTLEQRQGTPCMPRVITYRCSNDASCGGIGDRIKGQSMAFWMVRCCSYYTADTAPVGMGLSNTAVTTTLC